MGAGFEVGIDLSSEQLSQSVKVTFERNAGIYKTIAMRLNQSTDTGVLRQ